MTSLPRRCPPRPARATLALAAPFATAALLLVCGGTAQAQESTLLSAPPALQAPEAATPPPPPDAPARHPAGEGRYPLGAPIGDLFDLQIFGEAGYKETDWFRQDYDYQAFSMFMETRLLAPNIPGLASAHIEPFVRTIFSGNGADADDARDPYFENIFLYGVGVAWRPVRLAAPPPADGSGSATFYDWVEPLRLYAQKDWWTGLRSSLSPLPRDDWRVGLDYYLETRSVSQPHYDRLWAELFWDLRWHDTNFFQDDFQDVAFSSTVKAGANWPYLGEKQALQPYLALDLNASGNDFYLFNRVSGGAGLRITADVPLGGTSRNWSLRTRWFVEYQHEIGYFHERLSFDGDFPPPDHEVKFGVSFSLNRY